MTVVDKLRFDNITLLRVDAYSLSWGIVFVWRKALVRWVF